MTNDSGPDTTTPPATVNNVQDNRQVSPPPGEGGSPTQPIPSPVQPPAEVDPAREDPANVTPGE